MSFHFLLAEFIDTIILTITIDQSSTDATPEIAYVQQAFPFSAAYFATIAQL
jgi:hypothetical protein